MLEKVSQQERMRGRKKEEETRRKIILRVSKAPKQCSYVKIFWQSFGEIQENAGETNVKSLKTIIISKAEDKR